MQTYVSKRDNLPVLFHLVDSRHGPSADDERIMSEIGSVVRDVIVYRQNPTRMLDQEQVEYPIQSWIP